MQQKKIRFSPKQTYQVLEQIGKLRISLSANQSSELIFDYQDEEMVITVTRQLYYQILQEELSQFRAFLEQFGPIERLELLGGGSRMPIIQEICKEVCPQVGRTLNNDESMVKGGLWAMGESLGVFPNKFYQ